MFMIHVVPFKFIISFPVWKKGEKIKSGIDTPQTLWCFSKSHSSFATSPHRSEKRKSSTVTFVTVGGTMLCLFFLNWFALVGSAFPKR